MKLHMYNNANLIRYYAKYEGVIEWENKNGDTFCICSDFLACYVVIHLNAYHATFTILYIHGIRNTLWMKVNNVMLDGKFIQLITFGYDLWHLCTTKCCQAQNECWIWLERNRFIFSTALKLNHVSLLSFMYA